MLCLLSGAFVNYSEDSGIAVCSKCSFGKYSTQLSTSCTHCPLGTFSAVEGQGDSCPYCSSGTFSDQKGQTECQFCELGKYNENDGLSFCSACTNNGITLQNRSNSFKSCICPSGKYGNPVNEIQCRNCPPYRGIECKANSTIPFVLEGFWRNSVDFEVVHQCYPSTSCVSTGFKEITTCADSFRGVRCAQCPEGKFRSNKECAQCPWFSWLFLCIIIIGFLFLFLFILLSKKNYDHQNFFSFRIIISSIQFIGVISRFISLPNDSVTLSVILSAFDIGNFNFEIFFSMEYFSGSFWNTYSSKVASIYFLFPVMFAIGYVVYVLKKESRKITSTSLHKAISSFITILKGLYIYILTATFSAFRCVPQDDGTFTLLSSPELDCYDEIWFENVWVIVFGILVQICVPCYLFFVLYRNRFSLNRNDFYWRFGSLYAQYKPKYYFWDIAILLRKTLFVSLIDLTNSWQKLNRTFVLILFLLFEWQLDALVDPFQKKAISLLEVRSVWQLLAVLLILTDALIYRSSFFSTNQDSSASAISTLLIIYIFLAFCFTYFRIFYSRNNHFSSFRNFCFKSKKKERFALSQEDVLEMNSSNPSLPNRIVIQKS
jgi:hypothetical protein